MRAWKRWVRKRAVVNLVTGTAISGVLFEQAGPLLVMKEATVHEAGAEPLQADGELLVELSKVDYIQIVG